jgi:hypothetical protein
MTSYPILMYARPQIIVSDANARQATKHSAAERRIYALWLCFPRVPLPGECLIFRQNNEPYKVELGRRRVIAWNPP